MIQTIADALTERGYDTLTAVQTAVTDPELSGADLLVSAQTGSGKTVGFGLAIADTLLAGSETLDHAAAPLALVIAPTRELAFQVMRELSWLYAKAGARVVSCVGGMDMRDERRALDRGAHIVVGTPGRLRDHIQRGSLDMSELRAVVLDEADEMLDLGFREDLEFMLGEAPEDRRTLLFSATVPPSIAKLAEKYQRDAVRVTTLSGTRQHADIAYQALQVAQHDAENAIINVLRYHDSENTIVFANTRAMVARLAARLSNRGFSVVVLSGELSQSERTHALQAMRDGRARVCVATDVAARGIDLPNLDLVVHAELPSNAEGLLHRSGRTGRAGRKGISALIVTPKIAKKAQRLLKFAKIDAEWTVPPSAADILAQDEQRLIEDPVWQEEMTPEQVEFAAKLLAAHSPERIAAAYLALYHSRHSAPEELSPPDAKPERREPRDFGPSTWFALSVGRDERAEPRWLLPLLCRAGNLDKDAIGAIRIQQNESFVEISDAHLARFLSALGEKGELEQGVSARRLEAAPDFAASRPRGDGPRKAPGPRQRPQREWQGGERGPKAGAPAEDGAEPVRKAPTAERSGADRKPRKPKGPTKLDEAVSDGSVKPFRKPKARAAGEATGKPAPKARFGASKPETAKPARKGAGPKPEAGRPRHGKSDDPRPRKAGPGQTGAKGKPGAGKPGAGKPAGKKIWAKAGGSDERPAPAKPKKSASDTSKRFTPPGQAPKKRPGAADGRPRKRPGHGGIEPPRRPRS